MQEERRKLDEKRRLIDERDEMERKFRIQAEEWDTI